MKVPVLVSLGIGAPEIRVSANYDECQQKILSIGSTSDGQTEASRYRHESLQSGQMEQVVE